MSHAIPREFSVLTNDGNWSEFSYHDVKLGQHHDGPPFLDQALPTLISCSLSTLFAMLCRGVHQYKGAGHVASLDIYDLRTSFLMAASMSGVLTRDEVNSAVNERWRALGPLMRDRMHLTSGEEGAERLEDFRRHFSAISRQLVRSHDQHLRGLDGWGLTYPSGLKLSASGSGEVRIKKSAGRHTAITHHLTDGESPEGLVTAFEDFLSEGSVDPQYALPIAITYHLPREVIPDTKLDEALAHDLGL
jgi:hypothetical protein